MKAAIDIGTNTVLLLIGEVKENRLEVVREEQRIPRLGKGVDKHRNLQPGSIQRVLEVMVEYQQIIQNEYPEVEEVFVTATSAVRDAGNREEFIHQVYKKTGFTVRILSGNEEAQYTFYGAIATLPYEANTEFMVLDIGGGSTEVATGRFNILHDFHSFDMGCVRFSERYLEHNPPYTEEIFECRDEINRLYSSKKFKTRRNMKAVGVAGTLTSLAAIDLQIEAPHWNALNGHVIDRNKLSKSIEIFSLHTYDQLLELSPVLLKGREDIFLAGLLILELFLNHYKLPEIVVSTGGIRHGVLLDS